jgi:hypothetical protein
MHQIKDTQGELNQCKLRLLDYEELMRVRENQLKQLNSEREYLVSELKKLDLAHKDLTRRFDDQTRLLTNVASHKKNPAANMQKAPEEALTRTTEEAARAERISKQMNRSAFMGLGENPPQLFSESDSNQGKRVVITDDLNPAHGGGVFNDKNQSYLNDESVPSSIYVLIDTYRTKAKSVRPGDQLALLIDDFFGEAHAIMKDANLREIARIRNENTVEVMKLKKVIEAHR